MNNIAVLITVFNRVEKTVHCLEHLFASMGNDDLYTLDVYLVDDGSTDNTSQIIKKKFPLIKLIEGNGQLYWNGGMYLAWETAASSKAYDGYLWLNNDTFIYPNSLRQIIEVANNFKWKALICGSIESPVQPGEITYGGRVLKGNKYLLTFPEKDFILVDAINGNIVFVPQYVYKKLGNLDKRFTHAIGDFDYGLRAKKIGIEVIAIGFVGSCAKNTSVPAWCIPEIPLYRRLKNLYHPLGRGEPHRFFAYSMRHFGIIQAIKTFISQHIRLLFPSLVK